MPGAELRGSSFKGGDVVVALGVDLVEADSLQVGDALADAGGSVGVGGFEGVESFVDGGGAVELEIGEAPLPLSIVLIEPTIEVILRFLDFLQNQLEGRIHGAEGSLETGEVWMREIGGQDEDWKLMPIVRRRNLGKKIEEEQETERRWETAR